MTRTPRRSRRPTTLLAVGTALALLPIVAPGPPSGGSTASAGGAGLVLLQRSTNVLGTERVNLLRLGDPAKGRSSPWVIGSQPTWAPGGSRIAFVRRGRAGKPDVFTMGFGSSRPRNLTRTKGAETNPAWSPAGSHIAMRRAAGGTSRIVLLDVRTGEVTPVSGTTGGTEPAWAPDGSALAFVREESGARQVYRVGLDGSPPSPLTSAPAARYSSPAWSPDGAFIAVRSGEASAAGGLQLLDAVDGTAQDLPGTEGGRAPRWSSDGSTLYFIERTPKGASVPKKLDTATMHVSGVGLGRGTLIEPQPCPSACAPNPFPATRSTSLRLDVSKTERRVRVTGLLSAPADAQKVFVSLEKKRGSRFRRSVGRWSTFDARRFRARLIKPFKGTCRVRVGYPGGLGRAAAVASKTFDCFHLPAGVSLDSFFRVPGSSKVSGPGPVRTFAVEVQRRTMVDPWAFAAAVEQILLDQRSWGSGGYIGVQRVGRGSANIVVTLAMPGTVDRICSPYRTVGRLSCYNHGRAMINVNRWKYGSHTYPKLKGYRRYIINHEVGHGLGHHGHRSCPSDGRAAPVMMQQSLSLHGCGRAPWPASWEKALTPR